MQNLFEIISGELTLVEENLYRKIEEYSPEVVRKIAFNLLSAGGKRIRPALVILSASAVKKNFKNLRNIINLATLVEIVHMASLIHDDVIDESETRRNIPTAHKLWGNKIAILSGDHLLSVAFNILYEVVKNEKDNSILETFAKTMQNMCEGAIYELKDSNRFSEEEYLNLIKKKTASLFSTSCYVGAKYAGGEKIHTDALSMYGMNFGIVFQIIDDLLDFISIPEKIGKPVFSDLKEFKVTLPVINLYSAANIKEKKFLEEYFIKGRNEKESVRKIFEMMEKYKIFKKTKYQAEKYTKKAMRAINLLPENSYKEVLRNLLLYSLEREK